MSEKSEIFRDTVELSREVVDDILNRDRRIAILDGKAPSPLWNEFSNSDLAFLTGERRS